MSTQVIKRNVDDIGMGDLLRPEIKLIQNTGGDAGKAAGAKPGHFFNTVTGQIFQDGFEFVLLDFSIQRTYWGRDVIGDEPPMCTSMNANSYESTNGLNCRKCDHMLDNAAMIQAKERREKCTKQYSFMGLLLPNLEPFQFRAAGTSSTAVQGLMTRFRFNRFCRSADGTAIEYHRFKIAISCREEKTAAGSAWVIKFGDITPLNDANIENELFIVSAQMLGQGSIIEQQALPEGSAPTPLKIEQPSAPKITNVSPPPPAQPPTKESKVGKPAKSMNLDI